MSFIVLPIPKVRRLCVSAQNVQFLIDNGRLSEALCKQDGDSMHLAVAAFDLLSQNTAALVAEFKEVSPFLRYRREILGHYETAQHLRALVMNLWGGINANLGALFMNADEHHTRIALECIAGYTRYGENDRHFMDLADEIRALQPTAEVVQ